MGFGIITKLRFTNTNYYFKIITGITDLKMKIGTIFYQKFFLMNSYKWLLQ